VVGKLAAAGLGARIAGRPSSVALAVGSLMNARGLMALIVLEVARPGFVTGRCLMLPRACERRFFFLKVKVLLLKDE